MSIWTALNFYRPIVSAVLGLVGGLVDYAGSLWWCRVFRREMLGEAA